MGAGGKGLLIDGIQPNLQIPPAAEDREMEPIGRWTIVKVSVIALSKRGFSGAIRSYRT